MPFIIRQSQYYWVLAVCFLLIAVIYKGDFNRSTSTYHPSSPAAAQTNIQQRAIGNAVANTIGIDPGRGDSVGVVVRR